MRRHSLLRILGALILIGLLALGVFIATFDLDRYREELQALFSEALGVPVRFERASFALQPGPVLDFGEIRIGSTSQSGWGNFQARQVSFKVNLADLLHGRLIARDLLISDPTLHLLINGQPPEHSPAMTPTVFDPRLLQRLGLRSVTIRGGRVTLVDGHSETRPEIVTISHLEAYFSELAPGSVGQLRLTGQLEREKASADFRVSGTATLTGVPPVWANSQYQLNLEVRQLPPSWLSAGVLPPGVNLVGTIDLQADLAGSPAEGAGFTLVVGGKALTLLRPGGQAGLPLFDQLRIAGNWIEIPGETRLDNLTLSGKGLETTGALTFRRPPGGGHLAMAFQGGSLPLPPLLDLLPSDSGGLQEFLGKHLAGGEFRLDFLHFDTPLPIPDQQPPFSGFRARGDLANLNLELPRFGQLEKLGGRLEFEDATLTVTAGRGEFGGGPFDFGGKLMVGGGVPALELSLEGRMEGDRVRQLLPEAASELKLAGPLPLRGKVSGPLEDLAVDLKVELKDLAAEYREIFVKPAGTAGDLQLAARVQPALLVVERGRLRLPPFDLKFSGQQNLAPPQAFDFRCDLEVSELKDALPLLPFLEERQLAGALSLRYRLGGAGGALEQQEGVLTLSRVGLHLGGPLADLRDISGRITLAEGRAVFDKVTAVLGTSPLTLSGAFAHPDAPAGTLRLRAPSIRADELIFPSDQAYLRDLDARLRLGPDLLELLQVSTRLDGGTRAEVQGTVRNFRSPEVVLDIRAEYGNIDEVIALWHSAAKPAAPAEPGASPHKARPQIHIQARSARGEIGGMAFHDAEGTITTKGDILVIHPLRCGIGPGYAVGQVLVDHGPGSPPLLRISGHVEDVDAAAVHQQLLRQKSLVNGALRGDFYLQGRAGAEFLPTSLGNFSLEIRNGVLRKFKFLAKVFSLLNVSQILALKLPDMDEEGMPFDRLAGTFLLKEGVLSSEDLFIEGNAMNLSLVGQFNLIQQRLDAVMGVKPLRTVDKIITKIPLAGWLLAGEEKALITAHFSITGPTSDPDVLPVPINSISEKALGIFKRVLGLPGKVVGDVNEVLQGGPPK